jgi:hypothetical protein
MVNVELAVLLFGAVYVESMDAWSRFHVEHIEQSRRSVD